MGLDQMGYPLLPTHISEPWAPLTLSLVTLWLDTVVHPTRPDILQLPCFVKPSHFVHSNKIINIILFASQWF